MGSKYSTTLISTAIEFLRVAGNELGAEFGQEKVNAMLDAFDPELKAQVFMHLLMGDITGPIRIKFAKINGYSNKIQAIKTVRAISGMDLKEAKEFVEIAEFGGIAVMNGSFDVKQRRQFADGLIGTGYELA